MVSSGGAKGWGGPEHKDLRKNIKEDRRFSLEPRLKNYKIRKGD